MSTVSSFVYINPIEPAPLSLRIAGGVDTKIDITFYDQLGTVLSSDVAAQIELTPRTNGGPQIYYQVPAIDIVNGKARAVFPANTLSDPNGYRLNLYGTVLGEPMLIARGVIDVIAAPGASSVAALDTIDTIDLRFEYNEDVQLNVKLWTDEGKGAPLDLTAAGASVSANIYASSRAGTPLMPFTATVIASNEVNLSLTADQVNQLPVSCWWTLVASTGAGLVTLAQGNVAIDGVVEPPLGTVLASFDYQKPGAGDINPITGQIIHNTISQNVLKVSKETTALVDFSATLALVEVGDQITIGTTTWTVVASSEQSGWYAFTVTPIAQDATTGVTTVIFEDPV